MLYGVNAFSKRRLPLLNVKSLKNLKSFSKINKNASSSSSQQSQSNKAALNSNPFDYEFDTSNIAHLKTYICEYKFIGKVDNDHLILDQHIKDKINKSAGDYCTVYKAGKSLTKLIALKCLVLFTGLTLFYFLVLKKELVSNLLYKLPFAALSCGIIFLSFKARKLNLTSYINEVSLSKDLKSVLISTFPNKKETFNISDIFLGSNTGNSNLSKDFIIIYIKGKEYLIPLEFTSGYNDQLLPLVLRGYKLK